MRTGVVIGVLVLAAAALGFAAGFRLGADSAVSEPVQPARELRADPRPAVVGDTFGRLAAERAWGDLLDRLETLQGNEPEAFAGERLRLLKLAEQLAGHDQEADALVLLAGYVSLNPRDAPAQFLLSDLYQANGRSRDALAPLFTILDFPPDRESADRARRQSERLINQMVQLASVAGDVVALVDLYQALVSREPGYDKHRLGLARWMVRAGRYDEAAGQLKEVGNVGVSDDAIEAVRGELALAQSELPVDRVGQMLFAELVVAGVPIRMLVDTGATRSGLRSDVLHRVGAVNLGQTVHVRTAGGLVTAGVHRIRDLTLGEMRLGRLDVLALDALPAGVDGLLGMDLLSAYPRLAL